MRFLTNWQINLDKVPAYVELNQEFREQVDLKLAEIILNCNDQRLTPEMKSEFQKMVKFINKETNLLPVKYSPRYKLGRRYPDCPEPILPNGKANPAFNKYYSALISQPRLIKNTIFHYQCWIDIDQRKGHPNIIYSVAEKENIELPAYREYLEDGNFEKIVKEFEAYYNVEAKLSDEELAMMDEQELKQYLGGRIDEKDIKWLFNKTIYGGGHKKWVEDIQKGSYTRDGREICKRQPKELRNADDAHPFYKRFKMDTDKIISLVYLNNSAIKELVCRDIEGGEEMDWRRKNRVMSYWCGTIENEITFRAYQYLCKNNIIQQGFCDWGLDGMTIPPLATEVNFDSCLDEMNKHVHKQTGLKRVCFVRKHFKPSELLMSCIEARKEMDSVTPMEVDVSPVEVEAMEAVIAEDNSFESVCKRFEQNHCKITEKALFIKQTPLENILMSKQQLVTAYEHLTYSHRNKDGSEVKMNFITNWLRNNENQRAYDSIGVYPKASMCPANHFNMWTPFAMENVSEYTPNLEALEVIRNHIKILCGNDDVVADYFEKWIAQMIQFPEVKSICPTLVSGEGAGKGTLMKLMGRMLGENKVFETAHPSRDVWGDFNGRMANSFLVNLNELSKKDTLESEGRIKALITDPKLTINNKGVNQYEMDSYHRFLVTTNNFDPIKSSKDDRRKLIIRCSDEKKGDMEYFKKLHGMLQDVNVIKTCYEYFKSIEGVQNFKDIPMPQTEFDLGIKEVNMNPIEHWLKAFTMENFEEEGKIEMHGCEALNKFRDWCIDTNIVYEINAIKFGKQLTDLNIVGVEKGRHTKKGESRYYNIPVLKKTFKLGCLIKIGHDEDDMKLDR